MLTQRVIHPQILAALACAGHGSTVLIADVHYAASTNTSREATVVHLALEAGTPTVASVLDALLSIVAVESWMAIEPAADALPCPPQDEARRLIGAEVPCTKVSRQAFYAAARRPDLALCIVTGETARFGNLLLTLGVCRQPPTAHRPTAV